MTLSSMCGSTGESWALMPRGEQGEGNRSPITTTTTLVLDDMCLPRSTNGSTISPARMMTGTQSSAFTVNQSLKGYSGRNIRGGLVVSTFGFGTEPGAGTQISRTDSRNGTPLTELGLQ